MSEATPIEPSAPPPAKTRRPARLSRLNKWLNSLRTLGINVFIVVLVLLLAPVLVSQFWRADIVIEPISVPPALDEIGLKPDVVSNRLWDALQEFARSARTSKSNIVAIPDSRRVEFSFPDSGVSIDSLVLNLRRFFGLYDTRIGGEFLCADAACAPAGRHLRIRIVADKADVIDLPPIGDTSEGDYFREAAAGIYAVLDPFVAIAALADRQPFKATVLARRLSRAGHRDEKWALNLVGNIRINAGDPGGALKEYRAAVALDPGFLIARSNLGAALRLTGDLPGAKAVFLDLERRQRGGALASEGLSDVALAAGDRPEALRQLDIATKRDPLDPRLLAKAGLTARGSGNDVAAIAYFTRALEIDPGYPAAFAGLAAIHLEKGDVVEAEKIYRDAADYAPDDADAQFSDARLLLVTKNYTAALARLDRATLLAPTNVQYRVERARALQYLGRYTEALEELNAAKAYGPDESDVFVAMGDNWRLSGRPTEAIAAYTKFLALNPTATSAPVIASIVATLKASLRSPSAK